MDELIIDNGSDSPANMADCILTNAGTSREWIAIGESDADGYCGSVAYCHPENAKFIVRACNSHDMLVSALRDCLKYIEDSRYGVEIVHCADDARIALDKIDHD